LFVKLKFVFKFVLLYDHIQLLGIGFSVECDRIARRPHVTVFRYSGIGCVFNTPSKSVGHLKW